MQTVVISGLRWSEEVSCTEGPAGAMAQVGLCLVDWDQQEARLDQVREG